MTTDSKHKATGKIVLASESDDFFAVELHHHLFGSTRPEIIFEAAKRKQQLPKGVNTLAEFLPHVRAPDKAQSLADFLKVCFYMLPIIANDKKALHDLSLDFCKQQYESKIYYSETRFTPYEMIGSNLDYDEVMQTILRAFEAGSKKYGIQIRSILSLLCNWSGDSDELSVKTLELMRKYRYDAKTNPCGVVGLDIAGNEAERFDKHNVFDGTFAQARKDGFHCVVHAGEAAGAHSVKYAITNMCAERIGHGYRAVEDQGVMDMILEFNRNKSKVAVADDAKTKDSGDNGFTVLPMIHLECCPTSSVCTNAVKQYKREDADWSQHPIRMFLDTGMHFSINTDDPVLFQCTMADEIDICRNKLKMTVEQVGESFIRAMEAAFADEREKQTMLPIIKGRVSKWVKLQTSNK